MERKIYENKEKILSDLEYDLICDLVRIRKEQHLTQKEVAEKSDLIRETVAKIENKIVSPQINTLIKILVPLGYTLKIEKIKNDE